MSARNFVSLRNLKLKMQLSAASLVRSNKKISLCVFAFNTKNMRMLLFFLPQERMTSLSESASAQEEKKMLLIDDIPNTRARDLESTHETGKRSLVKHSIGAEGSALSEARPTVLQEFLLSFVIQHQTNFNDSLSL